MCRPRVSSGWLPNMGTNELTTVWLEAPPPAEEVFAVYVASTSMRFEGAGLTPRGVVPQSVLLFEF